ncbi:MAG: hypothetical protein K1Y02_06215 [Candidatus Hydrogenedentes bacterium]|nr:hypothetical protein [Candidatus Hydrogenedentota bacterium]
MNEPPEKDNANQEAFRVSERQRRKARWIARQLGNTKDGQRRDTAFLVSILAAFGGHIRSFQRRTP